MDLKQLRQIARMNSCKGVRIEPRVWWDQFEFSADLLNPTSRLVASHDTAYRNGEPFPIRITHVLACMRVQIEGPDSPPQAPPQGDPRLLHWYGMRFNGHSTYYQDRFFLPIPAWANVNTVGNQQSTFDTTSWRFDYGIPFANRDVLEVETRLETTPSSARIVSVGFDGVGRASKQPYKFGASTTLSDTGKATCNADTLRNTSAEIIDITGMDFYCSGPVDDADPTGDSRELRVQVKQTGSGTQRTWFRSPRTNDVPNTLMPSPLAGIRSGQAMVHKLPGDGWLFQQGQGVNLELEKIVGTPDRTLVERVFVALAGYVIIT